MFRISHKLARHAAVTSRAQQHWCGYGSRCSGHCFSSCVPPDSGDVIAFRATLGLAREAPRARTMEIGTTRVTTTNLVFFLVAHGLRHGRGCCQRLCWDRAFYWFRVSFVLASSTTGDSVFVACDADCSGSSVRQSRRGNLEHGTQ